MNPLIARILTDNLELYRDDPNMTEPRVETVAVGISMLFDALLEEADPGQVRALLYDIATACILAIEETYGSLED